MAELEGRTTRLAVLLGVSVIVIGVAAAVPHRANEIGAVAIGIGLFTICWLKGKRGFALNNATLAPNRPFPVQADHPSVSRSDRSPAASAKPVRRALPQRLWLLSRLAGQVRQTALAARRRRSPRCIAAPRPGD
jgi:hypothetical protein